MTSFFNGVIPRKWQGMATAALITTMALTFSSHNGNLGEERGSFLQAQPPQDSWHEHRAAGLRRLKRMSTMLRLGSQSKGDQICKWCSILGWMSWTYLGISEPHISFMDSYIHVILCSRKYIYTTVSIQTHTHIQSIHSHNAEPYYF